MEDYIEVAERLYKHINPESKMDTPNAVYIQTEKWYKEWQTVDTELNLFDWILKNKNENKMEKTQELTLGEKRVRTSFNVSGDTVVDALKQDTAILINNLEELRNRKRVDPENVAEFNRLISLAQTAYEEAAMWAVKAATI